MDFKARWSRHHRANPRDLSGVEIYFLESVENPGSREDGYPQLIKKEERWMVDLGCLATLDPLQGCKKRDDTAARALGTSPQTQFNSGRILFLLISFVPAYPKRNAICFVLVLNEKKSIFRLTLN